MTNQPPEESRFSQISTCGKYAIFLKDSYGYVYGKQIKIKLQPSRPYFIVLNSYIKKMNYIDVLKCDVKVKKIYDLTIDEMSDTGLVKSTSSMICEDFKNIFENINGDGSWNVNHYICLVTKKNKNKWIVP